MLVAPFAQMRTEDPAMRLMDAPNWDQNGTELELIDIVIHLRLPVYVGK